MKEERDLRLWEVVKLCEQPPRRAMTHLAKSGRDMQELGKHLQKRERPSSKAISIFPQFLDTFSYVDIVAQTCKSDRPPQK